LAQALEAVKKALVGEVIAATFQPQSSL